MSANKRFVDLGGGLVSEEIATTTLITYNPTTGNASVNFMHQPYIKPGDTYLRVGEHPKSMTVDLVPLMAMRPVPAGMGVVDPVTGADLSQISLAGMNLIIKFTFDGLYNRQVTSPAPVPPTP